MKTNPVALGTGFIALDVVCEASQHFVSAGGSCGNVLAILGYLGWESYPISSLSDDIAANQIQEEFRTLGLNLDFFNIGEPTPTPVIFQQFANNYDGSRTHHFTRTCPYCGNESPSYEPVSGEAVRSVLPNLPTAQVCYLDRANKSSVALAANVFAKGGLVVFEPSAINDTDTFKELCSYSHVIKYSNDRFTSLDAYLKDIPVLEVQTLGSHGLRYRSKLDKWNAGDWSHLPAFNRDHVIDSAGSGDWCTAGLLFKAGVGGVRSMLDYSCSELSQTLLFGQALGALNCGFFGARGLMYAMQNVDLIAYAEDIVRTRSVPVESPKGVPSSWEPRRLNRCFC